MRFIPAASSAALVGVLLLAGCSHSSAAPGSSAGSSAQTTASEVDAVTDSLKSSIDARGAFWAVDVDEESHTATYIFNSDPGAQLKSRIIDAYAEGAPGYTIDFDIDPTASVNASMPHPLATNG